MPSSLRARSLRRVALVVSTSAAGLAAIYACGRPNDPTPEASFAKSTPAGTDFALIRTAWTDPQHVPRPVVDGMLVRFLARYPDDGLTPVARAYHAFLLLDAGDRDGADRELKLIHVAAPGTLSDLVATARARWLRTGGHPDEAMTLLAPRIGKTVDPIARDLFQEELALTALAANGGRSQYEAIAYMDAWLEAASEAERIVVRERVAAIVARLPRQVLVDALEAMRGGASAGYGDEILHIVADRLAWIAILEKDSELARALLDSDAGVISFSGDAGVELGDLATSRRGLDVVEGRKIGLLLPTEDAALRDESADVLRGVLWALGKPEGVRSILPPSPASDAGAPVTKRDPSNECRQATLADDATLGSDEPSRADRVKLVTQSDSGRADKTDESLDELAGQGASVIIAALDEETADAAMRWSAARSVPVIVLSPGGKEAPGDRSFVLGVRRDAVLDALVHALPELGKGSVAPVVDASEVASFPQTGGAYGPLGLLPPVSCDVTATHAGDARFPIAAWQSQKARGWLVTGSTSCAQDLVRELASRVRAPTIGVTLSAAGIVANLGDARVGVAAAGVVPLSSEVTPRDEELTRFVAAFGSARMTWWTALGRDAAVLARRVVMTLSTDAVSATGEVARRRGVVAAGLLSAHARLWSTEARGFGGKHEIARSLCVVEMARAKSR
jgi:hypothetical protein